MGEFELDENLIGKLTELVKEFHDLINRIHSAENIGTPGQILVASPFSNGKIVLDGSDIKEGAIDRAIAEDRNRLQVVQGKLEQVQQILSDGGQ